MIIQKKEFIQDSEQSCGVYVILMILHHYKIKAEPSFIKELVNLNFEGTTVYSMISAFKHFNMEAKAFRSDLEHLKKHNHFPVILHTTNHDNRSHYVVLYKIDNGIYYLNDPTHGLTKITEAELLNQWTGILVNIEYQAFYETNHFLSIKNFLFDLFSTYKGLVFKISLTSMFLIILNIIISLHLQISIDQFTNGGQIQFFIMLSIFFLILHVIKNGIEFSKQNDVIKLEYNLSNNLYLHSICDALTLDNAIFTHSTSTQLLLKTIDVSSLVSMISQIFNHIIVEVFIIIITSIYIFIHYQYIFYCMIPPLLGYYVYILTKRNSFKQFNTNSLKLNNQLFQYLNNLIDNYDVIRRFMLSNTIIKKVTQKYHQFHDYEIEKNQALALHSTLTKLLSDLLFFITIFIGIILVRKSMITLGEFLLLYNLIMYLVQAFIQISQLPIEIENFSVIFNRYKEIKYYQHKEPRDAICLNETIKSIVFDDISFSYNNHQMILNHVEAHFCDTILIYGKSGSAKSTLLSFMTKKQKNYSGNIYINKQNLKQISDQSYLQKIAFVDQNTTFLDDSIYQNIVLYDDSKRDVLLSLLNELGLYELINRLDHILENNGQGLSNGQKQIVALMRVLINDYNVYIFDEATAFLDRELEKKIISMIQKKLKDKLIIFVSHDIKKFSFVKHRYKLENGVLIKECK